MEFMTCLETSMSEGKAGPACRAASTQVKARRKTVIKLHTIVSDESQRWNRTTTWPRALQSVQNGWIAQTGNMQHASLITNKAIFNGSKYSSKYLKLGLSISCALLDDNAKIKEVLNKMSIFLFLWIGTTNNQRNLVFFAQNELNWTLACEATSCPAILCRIFRNREVTQDWIISISSGALPQRHWKSCKRQSA